MNLRRSLKTNTAKQTKCESCHLLSEQDDQIQRGNKYIIYKSAFNKLSQFHKAFTISFEFYLHYKRFLVLLYSLSDFIS